MRAWMLAAVLAGALAIAAAAQEGSGAPAPEAASDADATPPAEAADLLSDDALDDLVAPVALYPDALLAQVFVAATYPLDVMKADRFLDDEPDLADRERTDRAEAEDWDESVRVLTGGFPDVIARMADEIDWTEELGDAMLVQTDDLLDAVQRMRAKAEAAGNLASNEAQTVAAEGDTISIAPADPEVVYVPAYDPELAYTTRMAAPPVVYADPGVSVGSALTSGAIAFGSALLIDEIFDDDDGWDDYWHAPRAIDWDDADIDVGRHIDVHRDVRRVVNRTREVNRTIRHERIGDRLRDGDRERWKADPERRDEALARIAARRDHPNRRPGAHDGHRRSEVEAKLKAHAGDGAVRKAVREHKGDLAGKHPDRKEHPKHSALKPGHGLDKDRAKAARERGASSRKHDVKPDAVKARAAKASHSKALAKAKAKRADAPRKPSGKKASAFKKSSGHAAKRGHSSAGKQLKRH